MCTFFCPVRVRNDESCYESDLRERERERGRECAVSLRKGFRCFEYLRLDDFCLRGFDEDVHIGRDFFEIRHEITSVLLPYAMISFLVVLEVHNTVSIM